VRVNGDKTLEANESFFVNLNNAHNAVIAAGRATVTIINDDFNSSPNVSINNPADQATYIEPAMIPIDVMANDEDGTVAKVQFFVNGQQLEESASGPYHYDLRDLPV